MSRRIHLVQGDTQPPLVLSLKDRSSGAPLNLASSTPRLKFRKEGSTTLQATVTGSLLVGLLLDDGTVDTSNATPGAGGRVQFSWGAGDLNGAPGRYEGEIEITHAGGAVQTMYDLLKFTVREDF